MAYSGFESLDCCRSDLGCPSSGEGWDTSSSVPLQGPRVLGRSGSVGTCSSFTHAGLIKEGGCGSVFELIEWGYKNSDFTLSKPF